MKTICLSFRERKDSLQLSSIASRTLLGERPREKLATNEAIAQDLPPPGLKFKKLGIVDLFRQQVD